MDDLEKVFRESTWADVRAGDIVLISDGEKILQVTVKEAHRKSLIGKGPMRIFVHYALRYAQYRVTYKPEETAYIHRQKEKNHE